MDGAKSSIILIGTGSAGCAMARGVRRSFGEGLRYLLTDTDAQSGTGDGTFVLLGGDRLSGRGAGGDMVAARLAAEESVGALDEHLNDVRLAVIVTGLGGGTGSGVTVEIARHLSGLGIRVIVFATIPFAFEGDERLRTARGVMKLTEEAANATFFLPLDKLVAGEDNMTMAMQRAVDTVASGVTLFWRFVEKPGYINIDVEHICQIVGNAGRGRFATVTVQGNDRATEAADLLVRSELLAAATAPVREMLCGVLAGEDLRLSEIATVTNGIRSAFGENLAFTLGTVNDEATFCGRMSVVVMLFEGGSGTAEESQGKPRRQPHSRARNPLVSGAGAHGRFSNAESTEWHGENLDIPTFLRRNISLDF